MVGGRCICLLGLFLAQAFVAPLLFAQEKVKDERKDKETVLLKKLAKEKLQLREDSVSLEKDIKVLNDSVGKLKSLEGNVQANLNRVYSQIDSVEALKDLISVLVKQDSLIAERVKVLEERKNEVLNEQKTVSGEANKMNSIYGASKKQEDMIAALKIQYKNDQALVMSKYSCWTDDTAKGLKERVGKYSSLMNGADHKKYSDRVVFVTDKYLLYKRAVQTLGEKFNAENVRKIRVELWPVWSDDAGKSKREEFLRFLSQEQLEELDRLDRNLNDLQKKNR